MNLIKITIFFLLLSFNGFSQTIEEIKTDRARYLWGEGKATSVRCADKVALDDLISQISSQVESSTEYNRTEDSEGYNEDFKKVIKTYSKATLNNTERIIISNEPDAHVFRYIKRSEVRKVFEQRKHKIYEFISSARKAKEHLQIADALRYYYWSMLLLESHPYSGEIFYTDEEGNEHLLISWLPEVMNNIFSDMHFYVNKIQNEENLKIVILDIFYKDKPISNFDYSYWDGKDWSFITSATDGKGIMEFGGVSTEIENVKLKAEYLLKVKLVLIEN